MIEYSSIEYHLHENRIGGDLAYLLDADLNSLADDFIGFALNQDRIIMEQGGNIETDRKKCAAFLLQFLECREFIYHTDYGREHWEERARVNITCYAKLYK